MADAVLSQWHQRRDRSTAARNNRRSSTFGVFQKRRKLVASFFRSFVWDFYRTFAHCSTVQTVQSGVKQTTTREAMPDLRLTIEDMIAEGDKIAERWATVTPPAEQTSWRPGRFGSQRFLARWGTG
jgi:hypothetical protein